MTMEEYERRMAREEAEVSAREKAGVSRDPITMDSLPGKLVAASFTDVGSHEIMIRKIEGDYWVYINRAVSYGPIRSAKDAYSRAEKLGFVNREPSWQEKD